MTQQDSWYGFESANVGAKTYFLKIKTDENSLTWSLINTLLISLNRVIVHKPTIK